MLEELRNHVAQKIGPIAKPANIVFTQELPKTRSGKIMRRLLRDVAENRALGDTTTLADPRSSRRSSNGRRRRPPKFTTPPPPPPPPPPSRGRIERLRQRPDLVDQETPPRRGGS